MCKMKRLLSAVLCCSYLWSSAIGIPVADFFQGITVKNCGTSILPPSSPDRIVGGKNVKHGQYPWIVSLHEKEGSVFDHICGASVLNENWIITAAHCIDYVTKPSSYQILVGLHKLSKPKAKTVQLIKIAKIVLHKDYDHETYENDIALLKTAKPIDIDGSKGYVNGICLPKTNKDPTGFSKVVGWGHTVSDGQVSDTLKEVVVPMVARNKCNDAYDDDLEDGVDEIKKTMICAGKTNKDSCQNDSGGPLFQTNSRGVATLVGIVSHGAGCGHKSYPGVYTKVSSYTKWIENVMAKN